MQAACRHVLAACSVCQASLRVGLTHRAGTHLHPQLPASELRSRFLAMPVHCTCANAKRQTLPHNVNISRLLLQLKYIPVVVLREWALAGNMIWCKPALVHTWCSAAWFLAGCTCHGVTTCECFACECCPERHSYFLV